MIHPSIQLELARQRQQEIAAAVERHRARTASMKARRRLLRRARARRSRQGDASDNERQTDAPATVEVSAMLAASHFGHREADGIVVDLFWDHREAGDEFRVEVEDRREGVRFVLEPRTGREAISAFHHPFAIAVLGDGAAPSRSSHRRMTKTHANKEEM